jgi:predicted SnoaL-like aldol condensation-catalyzing enzyme
MSSASHSVTTLDQNKMLVVRWFEEVWNQGRRETIFELFAEGGVIHDGPRDIRGPEEFARFYDALHAQFSDFKITPVLSLAEGDRACMHWSSSMTHTTTGKSLEITGTSIVRIENGKFVEAWQNWDAAHLFTQLTGQPTLSF